MITTITTITAMTQTRSFDSGTRDPVSVYADDDQTDLEPEIQAHPLGVRPNGNALTLSTKDARDNIGTFAALPDELILLLLEWLDVADLLRLGSTCLAFFAFTSNDDLWKTFLLRNGQLTSTSPWRGTWRATYLGRESPKLSPINSKLYSDALYRPFFCSQVDITPFVSRIPPSNCIPRLADLSQTEFSTSWSDRPFVLTEPVRKWPVFGTWSEAALLEKYGDIRFRAEAVDWSLSTYLKYMNNTQDESPLYLFDKDFVQKMSLTVGEDIGAYWPPKCFGEDLFALLGEQRPDSRWLIVGPERSGSTFHKDPNATSAWNAVIRGSKYWILFPSSVSPPGVFVSKDQSEITSPLSIVEWLLNFHEEARRMAGCVEGICREGEVLHVPSGWWHLVVNLEPAIAVTQNFVPRSHLKSALDFLEKKPDQVSGFSNHIRNPYQLFLDKLRDNHIELFEQQQAVNVKKRKWQLVLEGNSMDAAEAKEGFNFGFADNAEEEIP